MKKFIMSVISTTMLAGCSNYVPQFGVDSDDAVINAMTAEEKALLLIGTGMEGNDGNSAAVGVTEKIIPGAAGTTHGIERLGIPEIVLADGPAGLRIKPIRRDTEKTFYCTAFPVATVLSSTWNTQLVENVGNAMGNEVHEYGVDVILGPGVNIHRNPLCGRNYEYYSEDPVLAGKTAAAIIRGIEKNDVGTSIKHFAANNQETARTNTDSRVSMRALREIYLKPFEIAIKEANPRTVMTSYNYLNGVYTSENKELNQTILRDEWNFGGLVMTDWFAGKNTIAQVESGNDLLMPGTDRQYEDIINALKNKTIDENAVNANIKRIFELIRKSPRYKGYKFSNNPDLKSHAQITRQAACEGTVLLKNAGGALPFSKQKNIAVFGIVSYDFISGGIGSGDVNEEYTVSLTEGLRNAGLNPDKNLETKYLAELEKQYSDYKKTPEAKDSMVFKYKPYDIEISENDIKNYAKTSDAAVITFGRCAGEFKDRRISDFKLSETEKTLLTRVCKAFKAVGKKTIVILNIAGVVETASWRDLPDAIILPWLGGQEGGNAVTDILMGKENPSGKLPMTFPMDYFDLPSAKNFPYDFEPTPYTLFGSKDSIYGVDNRQKIENLDFTNYIEDVFVGYRYFTTVNQKTAYPFGFGLSYTNFEFSNFVVERKDEGFSVKVNVKNVGKMAGKEVAQIYVSAPQIADYKKPNYELKAFAKTNLLQPGEQQTLTFEVSDYSLASFNEKTSSWQTDAGKYVFFVGNSSENLLLKSETEVSNQLVIKTSDVLKQKVEFEKLIK